MWIVWDMWESRQQTLVLKKETWGYWWATRTRLPSSDLSDTLFILIFIYLLISGFCDSSVDFSMSVCLCIGGGGIKRRLLLALTEGWMSSAVCDFQVSLGVSLTWTEGIEIVCLFSPELCLGLWETPGLSFVSVDWVRQWDSLSLSRLQTHRRSGQQRFASDFWLWIQCVCSWLTVIVV